MTTRFPTLSPIAAAAWLLATHALAQTAPDSAQLQPVTVTGRATPPASVSGWGEIPLAKTPVQASVFDAAQLKDSGVQRLSDLTAADPAVSDAYNAEGYWDFLTVRGYVIDNRFNFRRDGLPINAETSIPLDNKARVEILKGTSGMQAGTSAPGGLVNYVVKRPLDTPLSSIGLEWRQPGTVTAAFDLSRRFGVDNAFGVRLNAAAAHLDPMVRDSEGRRHLFALAADWRVSPDTLLEAEIETSHRSQPSQPGFSMLGDTVPPPGDPRLSLNNQPWSLPVVMNATTASLRWQQRLSTDWRFVAHAATQQLRTDDRLAFPFGCFDPNPAPDGTYYADRYCPNGTYDLYDFRSENERRRTDALDLSLQGKLQTGAIAHTLTAGVLQSRVRNRFQQQAYNYVGTGNVEGTLFTSADPSLTDENTNRDERSTELYLRDAVALTDAATAWLGVRHSRIERESVRTDGSRPTDYAQSFTTPSIALSYAFARDQLVYASWGQGVESNVVTNRPRYSNAGEVFTTKSRQAEIGLKGASDAFDWNLAAFDIRRPRIQDFGSCDADGTCTTRLDGTAHHRGIEASAGWRRGAWALRGGAQWLRAKVEGSADPTIDGQQPTNVPQRTLKLQAAYDVAALPGLNLQGGLVHESARMVLPENSASIPGWTRVDAALRYETQVAGVRTTWRAGVDNLFDKRAWRESPYQFSHAYLYPLAPRTFRLSMQVDL
ncbi:TonB-dependent siderophore receptor [Rhizobacter sp. Root404]|uniref:TonB-dependent siderophore receptor n=1 Tax=Rhizobacter sp. Root404 TaxID=1736528 RepID=UPI001F26CC1D|nr:TonB-dependent siderophore receptor [Rhizobacter sp. Root404]